ncbi:hypothetical protein ACFSDI_04095 [Evansella tamaricis]
MYRWYFPINAEGGQPEGLNDSGVESFRGNQIESLAREIIQNSTDARKINNKPVKVLFRKFFINKNSFPNRTGLLKSLDSCREYKRTPHNAKDFFKKAINILETEKITFLQVSDFNTTGLVGVSEEASDWENLVKSIGISNKGGSSGGSFGIGKSAPFACSNLRTIFYHTYNQNHERAFQGVSRLASHFDGENETRGTGFYGLKKNTQPITNSYSIPKWYDRKDYGTDIFVAGFINDDSWEEKIIMAVLENFFVAIYEEKLIVEVGKVTINKSNLKMLIDRYIKINKNLYANEYFSAITFGERTSKDIKGLGTVLLYLQKNDEFSKKVAMVRSTGMKITHMDRFRGGIKFSGVLLIQGQELNKLLRKTEPPAHDKWEAARHEDPKLADSVIKELGRFVRESVKGMNKFHEKNKLDFKGFNKFLPDYLNEDSPLEENSIEENQNSIIPKTIKVNARRNKKKSRAEIASKGKGGNTKYRRKNTKKRKTSNGTNSRKRLNITRIKSIVVSGNKGIYDLKIGTDLGGDGWIKLNFIGEDSRSYDTNPITALDLNMNKQLPITNGRIGPVNFDNNDKKTIRVELEEKLRASLEVIVDES